MEKITGAYILFKLSKVWYKKKGNHDPYNSFFLIKERLFEIVSFNQIIDLEKRLGDF